MQSLISANAKSITESSMVKSGDVIPYYQDKLSMNPLGIQFQDISPYLSTPGAIANNSITFKLPAGAGFLLDASIALLCTCTVDAADVTADAQVAMNLLRSLEWLSNGQPILYQTGNALQAAVAKHKNLYYQSWCGIYSKMLKSGTELPSTAADTTFLTYVPLLASFLSEPEKCLLLDRVGNLELRITFNSVAESGLTNAVTGLVATLHCQTYMPILSVYQKMITNDWTNRLVMEGWNTYDEIVAPTSTTSTTYTLTVPFLAYKTHIFVKADVLTDAVGGPIRKINTITMNLNGTTFLNSVRASRLESLAAKRGVCNFSVDSSDTVGYSGLILTIDWGILCGRDANSGTAFFQELQGTSVTVTYDSLTVANNKLHFIHEYFNTLAYEPGSSGLGYIRVGNNN